MLRQALILLVGFAAGGSVDAAPATPPCTGDHRPVCGLGTDGVRADFPSACEAEREGATVLHPESCEAPGAVPSMCSHLYKPVCASDPASHAAKTYPNLCTAEQANAPIRSDGGCPTGAKGGG